MAKGIETIGAVLTGRSLLMQVGAIPKDIGLAIQTPIMTPMLLILTIALRLAPRRIG